MDIIILCGGSGTRLFPLSRSYLPKQFLNLVKEDKSMFQMTLDRASKITNRGHLYIICNKSHLSLVEEQIQELENYTIIIEPVGRNTAAAICIISQLSESKDFLVMSSDHIWNDEIFCQSVEEARLLNEEKEKIIVFGIQPNYPETGYGYLHHAENHLKKFVEKPTFEVAQKFLTDGNYLWNSGNFLINTIYIQQQFQLYCADIWKQTENTIFHSEQLDNNIYLNEIEFIKVRDTSIDYAIMEHQTDCGVVVYKGEWNDIGSFSSLHSILSKDEEKNVFQEEKVISYQSSNNLVKTLKNKIVCLSNVENTIVIETNDVLYIGNLNNSQNVKKIVEKLKEEKRFDIL